MIRSKYFGLKELVSKAVYEKHGENAWKFLTQDILDVADWIKEGTGLVCYINNWQWGGEYQQRGYRGEDCTIGARFSPHKEGKAIDISVKGWTDEQLEAWIIENIDSCPHRIRIEDNNDNSKVHIDVRSHNDSKKYHYFKP